MHDPGPSLQPRHFMTAVQANILDPSPVSTKRNAKNCAARHACARHLCTHVHALSAREMVFKHRQVES